MTGYFCFSLIPFVSKCAQLQFLGKEYWDFYRYNSIFILLSAVCLFGWVVTSKERNSRVINSIAGTTFGIFLFHTQYIMRDTVLWKLIIKPDMYLGSVNQFLLHLVCSVMAIFCVGALIDLLRERLFDFAAWMIAQIRKKLVGS